MLYASMSQLSGGASVPTRNEHTDPRANEPTQSMRPATLGIAEAQLTLFGQWIRSTYDVSRLAVQLQRAGLEANLSVLPGRPRPLPNATSSSSRTSRNAPEESGLSNQARKLASATKASGRRTATAQ